MNMNPTDDLLTTLATNRWRLDCRKDTGEYRAMYWCESCGLWRCVETSGAYHPTPHEAIRAAVQAKATCEPRAADASNAD